MSDIGGAKRSIVFVVVLFAATRCPAAELELEFSTYFGGKGGEDTARAVAVDAEGNIYMAGGTMSADFPTTPGAYDRAYGTGGQTVGSRGPMDACVTKFDRKGRIAWSTLLGGPNYDRVYTVRVDRDGFVYLAGRAGEGFPTTPGTVQPQFAGDGDRNGAYGKQDGFITKLTPDGSKVVWSTYFGGDGPAIIRDMDLDAQGNIYVVLIQVNERFGHATPGAFQERPQGDMDSVVAKISADARRVLWCSYIGGSGRDLAPSLRVDKAGRAVIAGSTFSTDFPTTERAFQRRSAGGQDALVARFSPDGSRLEYSTLLGGSDEDGAEGKHGLALDAKGRACVLGFTSSADFPTTDAAFQRKYHGGTTGDWRHTGDRFVAVLSEDGSRLVAATYLGGNARDGGEGIDVDPQGRVYLGGLTYSDDFPVTPEAVSAKYSGAERPHGPLWGGGDATVVVLSPDLRRLVYATYLGGRGEDMFRACALGPQGEVALVGTTTSRDWPTRNAIYPTVRGGPDDIIVAKFRPGKGTSHE